ncbi:penicillin acylase family protein [Temperatibacter marinus]|uniref:Penicillin acylase family protein n=1 Tax=Temperatibacter marinus TaxID=1456591 RepID=A0AA52EJV8_9PROT|nr:penicillin acylase family protein [Temperatibacter marinus]WND03599.1 penicillin acylase family protein [Temperatibacter marinus]
MTGISKQVSLILFLLILSAVSHADFSQKEVIIKRDQKGVPHIYADDKYGLFLGYGYSVAQDRLFQMEMIRRSAKGTVSEVLGDKYISFDKAMRVELSITSVREQVEALLPNQRAVLEGYADGMNRWIKFIETDPDKLLPKEYAVYNFLPRMWDAVDVAMVFTAVVADRFSDFSTELENLALLNALQAQHGEEKALVIFNQLNWINDPKAPTTVPTKVAKKASLIKENEYSSLPKINRDLLVAPRMVFNSDGSYKNVNLKEAVSYYKSELAASGISGSAGHASASNIWLIGQSKSEDSNGYLLNGPQFGWINPSYVYSVGLHGAGLDVVGNSYFAIPPIFFAHNKHIAWGSTAGMGDTVDYFIEELNPNNLDEYFYKGRFRPMEKHQEIIHVKGLESIQFNISRTVHGPIVRQDNHSKIAFSRKRTWDGKEVQSLFAFMDQMEATTYDQWKTAAARNAVSVNWYYIDKAGNIGYFYSGHFPNRAEGQDSRLPTPGTGNMEWQGVISPHKLPQVYNPKIGYIVNWNNKPANFWPNGDPWYVVWTSADRATELFEVLDSKKKMSYQDVIELNRTASFKDLNIRYFLPFLENAVSELPDSDMAAILVAHLRSWDQTWKDKDHNFYYDHAGPVILNAWLSKMLETVLRDDIGSEFFYLYQSPGYAIEPRTSSTNITPGVKILYNALLEEKSGVPQRFDFFNGQKKSHVILSTLRQIGLELSNRYGGDLKKWRLPVARQVFRSVNFYGIPQTLPQLSISIPITMNRGSENNLSVMHNEGIIGTDVTPPGQSGFVAQTTGFSQHYRDQIGMYLRFEQKQLPFTKEEVEAVAVRSEKLKY